VCICSGSDEYVIEDDVQMGTRLLMLGNEVQRMVTICDNKLS